MSAMQLLEVRRAEREALLSRLIAQLHRDEQVAAAWLAGPAPEETDLSDIDLWLAVADEYAQVRVATRRDYVAAVARPLLVKEAPEAAPQGGACLLVLYAGRVGPHQVRWHWLARSQARLPQDARLLVDRGGVPLAGAPGPLTRRQRAQEAGAQTMLFWAMVHAAAQHIARGEPWATLAPIARAQQALQQVAALVGDSATLPAFAPGRHLDTLRTLAAAMERLTPQIVLTGASVPVQAIIQIQRFLDLAEELSGEVPASAGRSA